MHFRFLGTGTSVGVPQIGCSCATCLSSDPRDRRRRCGAYVTAGGFSFLIDTPPELRLACLEYAISNVDAVVLTHAHMDHVSGFDDIRRFNTLNGGTPLNCYALPETVEAMHRIFPYITNQPNRCGLFRPMVNFVTDNHFSLGTARLSRFRVEHGFPCCGYRIDADGGSLGYVSDCHALSDAAVAAFAGVDVMVLNCLRERPHPTHLNIDLALAYLNRIAPGRAYLIHICHDISHQDWLRRLPAGVEPAYDGLELVIGDGMRGASGRSDKEQNT